MYIFDLKNARGKAVGGKAGSLGEMLRMGLPVPSGYVITADAIENGNLKSAAAAELGDLINKLSATHTYAVRSSAIGEDGCENSFAGAYETVLDVKPTDIEKSVLKVAASAGNERVDVYSKERKTEAGGTAVVIQQYIAPDLAGVIFTADPISGSRGKMTGSFVKGAGEKLVSGEGMDGEFVIDAVKYAYSGSSEMAPYAKKLFGYAKKLAADGVPKDIEWAVSGGRVYLLQSRPVTTLSATITMISISTIRSAANFCYPRQTSARSFSVRYLPSLSAWWIWFQKFSVSRSYPTCAVSFI